MTLFLVLLLLSTFISLPLCPRWPGHWWLPGFPKRSGIPPSSSNISSKHNCMEGVFPSDGIPSITFPTPISSWQYTEPARIGTKNTKVWVHVCSEPRTSTLSWPNLSHWIIGLLVLKRPDFSLLESFPPTNECASSTEGQTEIWVKVLFWEMKDQSVSDFFSADQRATRKHHSNWWSLFLNVCIDCHLSSQACALNCRCHGFSGSLFCLLFISLYTIRSEEFWGTLRHLFGEAA